MNLSSITVEQLKRAVQIKEQIETLQNQLSAIIGGTATAAALPKMKGRMSAAGRARIATAQKARWAKLNGDKAPVAASASKRRPMSVAAKAKIAAAAKARWAKAKAAGKKSL